MIVKSTLFATTILAASVAVPALGADKPFDGVTLRVLSTQQPWDAEVQKRVAQFEEKTGATVEFDLYAFGQTVQKVAVELTSKSPAYDVVFLEASDVPRFVPGGFLEPLDGYVETAKFDIDDFIPSTIAAETVDGKLYGIPYFAATQLMYYRGDVLKAAGFDAPPKTFEELISMCGKLQTQDMPCTALRGKANTSENIWYWTQILYGYGGHWVKDFPNDMTPTINSPEAVKAAEAYVKLLQDYSIPGSASAGYDEVVVAMQQANVAIAIEGAPLAGRILDPKLSKVSGELGFAVTPGGPAGVFAPFSAQGWNVNAASRNKEAAAAFILWATSKEMVKDISTNSSFLAVTRNSIWADAAFEAKHGYDFGYGSFTKAYAATLAVGAKDYRLPFAEFRPMADRVGLALQEAAVGKKTAQQALDDAQADVTTIMKRVGYLK